MQEIDACGGGLASSIPPALPRSPSFPLPLTSSLLTLQPSHPPRPWAVRSSHCHSRTQPRNRAQFVVDVEEPIHLRVVLLFPSRGKLFGRLIQIQALGSIQIYGRMRGIEATRAARLSLGMQQCRCRAGALLENPDLPRRANGAEYMRTLRWRLTCHESRSFPPRITLPARMVIWPC